MIFRLFAKVKPHLLLIILLSIAALLFGLVSFVNHYKFRTYCLDLGLYTNALYDYAHFRWNDSLAFRAGPENLLSDHFDLYLPLFSPLIWIFGTWTLLVVQIASILFGALGVFRLVQRWFSEQRWIPYLACCSFLGFYGIWSALAFDYHSNVVAAMLVPWFLYHTDRKELRWMILYFVLILIAKENMSLWMFFIALGLVLKYYRDIFLRRRLMFFAGISLIYFLVITSLVMPALAPNNQLHNFPYSALGGSMGEAVKFLVAHPVESVKLLFQNHSKDPYQEYVKIESWLYICFYLVFLIRKPYYLLMIVPIIAQKMYSDFSVMWGVTGQYSIEFASILLIGTFDVLRSVRVKTAQYVLTLVMLVVTVGLTCRMTLQTQVYQEYERVQIGSRLHYERNYDCKVVRRLLRSIPVNASVSTQSAFVPHLALRDSIYSFPNIGNARYVFLHTKESGWPLTSEAMTNFADSLRRDSSWQHVYVTNEITLLKRK